MGIGDEKVVLDKLKLVNRLMYTLLGLSLFCLVVLFGPDVLIIPADAELEIPLVDQKIRVSGFLLFGPFMLIAINLYTQLYFGFIYDLPENIRDKGALYIFTMKHGAAKLLTGFMFYWLVPLMLGVFIWKALNRPEIDFVICLTIAFTPAIACLQIWRRQNGRSKILFWSIWLIKPVKKLYW